MTDVHVSAFDFGPPVSCVAPCKLNLTLDVLAPRPNGFHDLNSIVVPLYPPGDELKITVRAGTRGVRLVCRADVPKGPDNLAHKAAQVFLDTFAPNAHVSVFVKLEKRIPTQAGLGGGSSDAGAVLQTLAQMLAPLTGKLSHKELLPVAASLGSDVSLFLLNGPVQMQGRGEHVTPLSVRIPPFWGVLVKGESGVPTGPAYQALDALPNRTPGKATNRLLHVLQSSPDNFEAFASCLANDFEAAVLPAFPEVAHVFDAVTQAGALRTLLCGSGATVFGLARNRDHARDMIRLLAGHFPFVKLTTYAP